MFEMLLFVLRELLQRLAFRVLEFVLAALRQDEFTFAF
jgi:hypothetical protein